MKGAWRKVGVLLLLVFSVACSQQYREAEPQISSEDMRSLLEELQMNAGGQDGFLSTLNLDSLATGNSSVLYHAREDDGSPAMSVLSMSDMGYLGNWGSGYNSFEVGLTEIDAVFLDSIGDNGRTFTLMLRMTIDNGGQTVYFSGTSQPNAGVFTDDYFEVSIPAADGTELVIRSSDLSDEYNNELASSVKLNIYVAKWNGELEQIGQVSTMAGYR